MASVETTHTKNGERRYVVRYRDPVGKSHEKWYRRKVDAEKFARTVEVDKDHGERVGPRAGRALFSEIADRWLATRIDKAPSTQRRDRLYINSLILPTFANRPIASISPSEIEAWLAKMDKAPNTRGKALQLLRSILDLARRDRLIAMNHATDVKPPTVKALRVGTALSVGQINDIIAVTEDLDERTAVLVHLMGRCGLRIGEALALRRKGVDLDRVTVNVRTSMPRSGRVRPVMGRHREDEGRVVPIPDDVARRLRRHFAERRVASIDFEVTPHDLRRTAATRLFAVDRWNPAEVQAFLGHSDPRVTLAICTLVEAESLPRPSTLNRRSR